MSFWQELSSWWFPTYLETAEPPEEGHRASSSDQLRLPCDDSKPAIVVFLRHCGCPFAEKTFRTMRTAADFNPDIHFIAVSHSTSNHTENWLNSLGGSEAISMIVDHERTLYARWGLGPSSLWHLLSPWAMWDVVRLGRSEGIWNRPTESGSRWQRAGAWAVDGEGRITWGRAAKQSSDCPNFDEAVRSVS